MSFEFAVKSPAILIEKTIYGPICTDNYEDGLSQELKKRISLSLILQIYIYLCKVVEIEPSIHR